MTLTEKLSKIQADLKAPKNQFNAFGKYKYRSCEDILEGVKPILNGLILTLSDKIEQVGDRIYVTATARLTDGSDAVETTASARESLTKKGMDDSQITGTASSYARKYALNGLFCIDDTKDADSMDNKSAAVKTQFKIDDLANNWISAVKNDAAVLEQIADQDYKAFIKTNAGI
ncbi:MAG: ERF family protein [Pseudomonadales bacterium]